MISVQSVFGPAVLGIGVTGLTVLKYLMVLCDPVRNKNSSMELAVI